MIPEVISIIIPVYKVELYLDKCIDSVVNQTYKHLEIILVDDGSPDRCGAICDEWAKKDSRIIVIHKKNGGLSDARNCGLNAATGTYIAFVDSDDFIASTMIEILLRTLLEEKADIVECNYVPFINEIDTISCTNEGEINSYTAKEALGLLIENCNFKYTVWNKLYHKDIFNTLKFEVGKLHEDVFFTYQAFGYSKKITKVDKTLYFYRQRTDSIMGSPVSFRNLDSLEARKNQYFFVKKNYPELSGKAQSQVLGNSLYFAQKVLRESDSEERERILQHIQSIFNDVYVSQDIQENLKQKMWYCIAKWDLKWCSKIRNWLKIGV